MPVLLSMAIAVLIWGSYPYAAVLALNTMTGLELIFISTIVASLAISLVTVIYFVKNNNIQQVIQGHKSFSKSTWVAIFASGITHIVCNGFFFLALGMSHKAGVSLVYESWPIIAVVATPFFIRKKWKEVGLQEFIVSIIAMCGVVVVILSNEQIDLPFGQSRDLNKEINYVELLGYVVAFLGGYACALNAISKGYVAEVFRTAHHQTGAIIMSEFYSRVIALIIMLISLPLYYQYINWGNIEWLPSIYIGFVVLLLGGFFYTYSLINTDLPTIHILYYFVPLLAVLILWMMGESTVNTGIWLGGILIVVANIYLYFSGRSAKYSE